MIPTDRPQRITGGVAATHDSSWSGDIGELVAPHHGPLVSLAIPFSQHAAGHGGIGAGLIRMIAIVGVNVAPLSRIKALAVIAGEVCFSPTFQLLVLPEFGHFQGVDINLINAFLHGCIEDLVGRICEAAGIAGRAAEHFSKRNRANLALRIDHIRPDEKLLRFRVDHAVRRGAADAFRTNDLLEIGSDFVELVGRALWHVRCVGDDPQPTRPGNDRPGSAFAFVVEVGKARIDAGKLQWCG